MNKYYSSLLVSIIINIIFVVIFIYFYIFYGENLKESFINNNIKCDNNGCPSHKIDNIFYKLHNEYKKIRDKNKLLAHTTLKNNFIFKEKGPANIFIVRHAEKIKSKFALDCNGILRSTYISNVIEDLNNKGFGIHSIIAPYDYSEMHKAQTVSLASWLMNINIFMYGDKDNIEETVKQIYKKSYYDGKTILICWEHDCIQKLLKTIISVGSKTKGLQDYTFKNIEGTDKLPYWDTNNYSSIYHLDDKLNFSILNENIQTCYDSDNNIITYGKKQQCGK